MLLGVVSDTHGQVSFTRAAVRMLEAMKVDVVIHCGDIGSPDIIPLFKPWPTHFVFGNVDYDHAALGRTIEAAGQFNHQRGGELELVGKRIAFLHGDDQKRLDELIASGAWDLVCHGHTHVARQEQLGRTLVLNPGAIYRANPHSLAVVRLPEVESHVIKL